MTLTPAVPFKTVYKWHIYIYSVGLTLCFCVHQNDSWLLVGHRIKTSKDPYHLVWIVDAYLMVHRTSWVTDIWKPRLNNIQTTQKLVNGFSLQIRDTNKPNGELVKNKTQNNENLFRTTPKASTQHPCQIHKTNEYIFRTQKQTFVTTTPNQELALWSHNKAFPMIREQVNEQNKVLPKFCKKKSAQLCPQSHKNLQNWPIGVCNFTAIPQTWFMEIFHSMSNNFNAQTNWHFDPKSAPYLDERNQENQDSFWIFALADSLWHILLIPGETHNNRHKDNNQVHNQEHSVQNLPKDLPLLFHCLPELFGLIFSEFLFQIPLDHFLQCNIKCMYLLRNLCVFSCVVFCVPREA